MPSWPIAIPSVTVMVQNSRGVPPFAATPFFTAWAWRISEMLQGRSFIPTGRNAHEGLVNLFGRQPHGIKVRAMRGARGPLRHMTTRQPRLDVGLGVHRKPASLAHRTYLLDTGCTVRAIDTVQVRANVRPTYPKNEIWVHNAKKRECAVQRFPNTRASDSKRRAANVWFGFTARQAGADRSKLTTSATVMRKLSACGAPLQSDRAVPAEIARSRHCRARPP